MKKSEVNLYFIKSDFEKIAVNMANQKKTLVLANVAMFDHEASRGPHMSS